MTNQRYICPACPKHFSTQQGVLKHFYAALQGLGQNPSKHAKWAKQKGIPQETTLLGGSQDFEGVPSGDLTFLKEMLYKYLDS